MSEDGCLEMHSSPALTFATEQTSFQLFEQAYLHALVPPRHETLEHHVELFLESDICLSIPTPMELDLQFTTGVADAHARSVRHRERAARRSTKRATPVTGARRFQVGGCRAGKPERRQLVIGEEISRVCRATVPAGPVRRFRLPTLGARFDRSKLRCQLFAQLA